MKFTNQVAKIKSHQDKLVVIEKDIKTGCKRLEKDIKKLVATRLKENFPNTKFIDELDWLVGVDGGCMTNRWTPEVYFYSVSGFQLSKKGFWFEDTIEKFEKVKPPINTREFLAFLKDLSVELGVKCRMIRHEPYWATERAAARLDSQFGDDDL